jgi:hypothetical protein
MFGKMPRIMGNYNGPQFVDAMFIFKTFEQYSKRAIIAPMTLKSFKCAVPTGAKFGLLLLEFLRPELVATSAIVWLRMPPVPNSKVLKNLLLIN